MIAGAAWMSAFFCARPGAPTTVRRPPALPGRESRRGSGGPAEERPDSRRLRRRERRAPGRDSHNPSGEPPTRRRPGRARRWRREARQPPFARHRGVPHAHPRGPPWPLLAVRSPGTLVGPARANRWAWRVALGKPQRRARRLGPTGRRRLRPLPVQRRSRRRRLRVPIHRAGRRPPWRTSRTPQPRHASRRRRPLRRSSPRPPASSGALPRPRRRSAHAPATRRSPDTERRHRRG